MFNIKISNLLNRAASTMFNALRVTSYENDYIFQGKSYSIETFFSIASGNTTYDIVFDTTNVTNSLVALPTTWNTTAGDVTINLGICTGYTDGTSLTPLNRLYSGSSSAVIFKYDVTPAGYSAGATNILVGSSSTNQSSGGGTIKGNLPIVLETGIKYVFRISNNSGENIKLGTSINWYEI